MVGPRRVGGRYYCGYWRWEYTVLAIEYSHGGWLITEATDEEAAEGRSRTHCTAWDERVFPGQERAEAMFASIERDAGCEWKDITAVHELQHRSR
jgi:hypothetical protein